MTAFGAAILVFSGLAATPEELSDFEAKAEYAFFTEDANALRGLLTPATQSTRPLELYHHAHAEFRLEQLARAAGRSDEAAAAGVACVSLLETAIAAEPDFAEALVRAAACNGYLAAGGGLRGHLAAHRASAELGAARRLAPGNARALLVGGLLQWFGGVSGGHGAARPTLKRAAAAFDTVVASQAGAPTWGAAESWLFVGRALEEQGDLLGARSAYEKALLVAPQFAAARRRLTALASRR